MDFYKNNLFLQIFIIFNICIIRISIFSCCSWAICCVHHVYSVFDIFVLCQISYIVGTYTYSLTYITNERQRDLINSEMLTVGVYICHWLKKKKNLQLLVHLGIPTYRNFKSSAFRFFPFDEFFVHPCNRFDKPRFSHYDSTAWWISFVRYDVRRVLVALNLVPSLENVQYTHPCSVLSNIVVLCGDVVLYKLCSDYSIYNRGRIRVANHPSDDIIT